MKRGHFLLILLIAPAAAGAAGPLRPRKIAERFVHSPDQPTRLLWQAEGRLTPADLDYVVRDYWDREVARGQAKVTGKGGVELEVSLPAGFHSVEFSSLTQQFGTFGLPAPAGKADPFFCIDSAMSWLVRPGELRGDLVRTLKRCGVAMSRERLTWGQVNPKPDQWAWDAGGKFDTLRKTYLQAGVPVLEMFHSATPWSGVVGKYPRDLSGTARSWQKIAGHWQPTWGALEVWNEPDIFFGANLPADQYVPLVKTLARAFADAHIDRPLVAGAFAHFHSRYLQTCAANGMLDFADAASFHTYAHAPQMEGLVGRYRKWLADSGKAALPLWLTECGRPWRRGPDRPPTQQGADSALDIVMKAVEARACGVARYFAFVYPFYQERQSNFGMMGREGTPLRPMAAYAALIHALADKQYIGDLAWNAGGIRRVRAFGPANKPGEIVAVLYSGRADGKATARLPVRPRRAAGIDGRALPVGKDRSVFLGDGLCYVWLDTRTAAPHLRKDTKAAYLLHLSRGRATPRRTPPPVVLRFDWDPRVLQAQTDGYHLTPKSAADVALRISVYNLSAKRRAVRLAPRLPEGGRLKGPAAMEVTLASIEKRGHAQATWRLDLRDAFGIENDASVGVDALDEDGRPLDRLVLVFRGGAEATELMRRFGGLIPLPLGDLKRWRSNAPSYAKARMSAGANGVWRLDVAFGRGDPWVYPVFTLPGAVKLSRAKAIALRARCEGRATVRLFLWEGKGVGYLTSHAIIPADGTWHSVVIPLADLTLSSANAADPNGRLDRDKVRQISLGLNSLSGKNTLEVAEAYVVYEQPKTTTRPANAPG